MFVKGGVNVGVDVIIEIINGVGFPIAVSVALFWQNNQRTKQYAELLSELTTIINNNTNSIDRLAQELEVIKDV